MWNKKPHLIVRHPIIDRGNNPRAIQSRRNQEKDPFNHHETRFSIELP